MSKNDDLPIRTDKPIYSGKVRAVYWLTAADSRRLIESRKYDVAKDAELAINVPSDQNAKITMKEGAKSFSIANAVCPCRTVHTASWKGRGVKNMVNILW